MTKRKNILVVAVHPDDESLGCGGTILKHKSAGDEVHWLIVSNIFEENGFTADQVNDRQQEIQQVQEIYKFDSVVKLDFPATSLGSLDKGILMKAISSTINDLRPDTIYLQHPGDIHSEHKLVFDIVMSCTKWFRYPFIKSILTMETISETEFAPPFADRAFLPNYFVNITDEMERKLEVLKIYGSELGEHPFPRSLENVRALALHRGAQCGVSYAESFMILKNIWN